MARRVKAYLPRWTRWIMLPMLVLIWALVTYVTFGTPSGREELGVIGWLIVSAVVILVGAMMWLMTTGRLHAYEFEIEDGDADRDASSRPPRSR